MPSCIGPLWWYSSHPGTLFWTLCSPLTGHVSGRMNYFNFSYTCFSGLYMLSPPSGRPDLSSYFVLGSWGVDRGIRVGFSIDVQPHISFTHLFSSYVFGNLSDKLGCLIQTDFSLIEEDNHSSDVIFKSLKHFDCQLLGWNPLHGWSPVSNGFLFIDYLTHFRSMIMFVMNH